MTRATAFAAAVTLLTAAAIAPLSAPWFVGSHDGLLAVARSIEMARILSDGAFPPRWAPDWFFGYGFPFFHFYAPLGYVMAAVPILAGAPPADAVEWVFSAGFVAGALGAFLWTRHHFGQPAGAIAALAYTYAPYRLVDAHYRGDFSEFLALSWLPWLLWAVDRAVERRPFGVPALAIIQAALVLTHNVIALITAPIGGIYAISRITWLLRRDRRLALAAIVPVTLGFSVGLTLSAFFWVPALVDKDTVQIANVLRDPTVDYRKNFPSTLISWTALQPYAGYDGGAYRYTVSAGAAQTVLAFAGLLALAVFVVQRRKLIDGSVGWFAAIALAALGLLMTSNARPVWDNIPLMEFVQFPWRFLGPAALMTAVLTGVLGRAATVIRSRWGQWLALAALAGASIVPNTLQLQPRLIDATDLRSGDAQVGFDRDLAQSSVMVFESAWQTIGTTSIADYLPNSVMIRPLTGRPALGAIVGGSAAVPIAVTGDESEIIEGERSASRYRVDAPNGGDARITFYVPVWPGWTAVVGSEELLPRPDGPLGLASVPATSGGPAALVWVGTPLQRIAEAVSATAAVALLASLGVAVYLARPIRGDKLAATGLSAALLLLAGAGAWLAGTALTAHPRSTNAPGLRPIDVEYGNQVRLAGYAAVPTPDERAIQIALEWRALVQPEHDYTAFVHLSDAADQVVGQYDQPLGGGIRPSSQWRAGDTVRDQIRVPVAAGTPPGVYHLKIGIYQQQSLQRVPITSEALVPPLFRDGPVRLGPIVLHKRNVGRRAESLVPASPSPKRFEEYVRFLGFDLEGNRLLDRETIQARPGDTLRVALYLRAIRRTTRDFTVFVHLLDAENHVATQQDRAPVGRMYPTFVWSAGETVVDRHALSLPADLAPGDYVMEVGLYDSVTKQRLGVDDGAGRFDGDRIVIGKVVVKTAP